MLAKIKENHSVFVLAEKYTFEKFNKYIYPSSDKRTCKGEIFFVLEKEKYLVPEGLNPNNLNVKILTLDGVIGWIFIDVYALEEL